MPVMIFTMLIVLLLAIAVIAVVVMGMEGTGRQKHPEIADAMARTARHLNGEGEPPRALKAIFEEIDEVPDLSVRDLPGKLRSLGSAASAASARSARSAWSALSARSATSANAPEVGGDAGADSAGLQPGEDADVDTSVWAPDSDSGGDLTGTDESTGDSPEQDAPTPARDEVAEALEAPIVSVEDFDDPYGVWGATEVTPIADASDEDDASDPDQDRETVLADAVVRVTLPAGEDGR